MDKGQQGHHHVHSNELNFIIIVTEMVQYMKQVAGVSENSTTLSMQMPQSDLTHNIFFLYFSLFFLNLAWRGTHR